MAVLQHRSGDEPLQGCRTTRHSHLDTVLCKYTCQDCGTECGCGCLQLVYGLEHLVEITVAKKIPAAASATTLIARLANNVIGGENFIDMARWTGIQ